MSKRSNDGTTMHTYLCDTCDEEANALCADLDRDVELCSRPERVRTVRDVDAKADMVALEWWW